MHHTFYIIMLFVVSASTETTKSPLLDILDKCKTDLDVTQDVVDELYAAPESLLTNPKTRCFAACFLTENGILNADGTLNAKRIIETMPKNIANREKVIAAFNSCANLTGADNCETALKTIKCTHNKDVRDKEAIENNVPIVAAFK